MSRVSFATSQWKTKIKRGITRVPIGYNQILLEGLPYATPPKPNKTLRVIESPIYEYAKEFAQQHKEIGYLADGRLSQDSMNYSYMKFNYLKKGLSFIQASLQAKRDLVKNIEIRSMELDMIQNQALKMGIPSFKPKSHLEHINILYQKVQARKDEFESISRREALEDVLRVKVLYNDFTPLSFSQVSSLTPPEFVKFVKEHSDYKTILSQPIVEDKKSSEEGEGAVSEEIGQDGNVIEKKSTEQQQQQPSSNPSNILGFRLEEYNLALGFNRKQQEKTSTSQISHNSLLEEFEKDLELLESKQNNSISGGIGGYGDINFVSNIKSGMDKSLIGSLNDFSIQLNPNTGKLELMNNSSSSSSSSNKNKQQQNNIKDKITNKFRENNRLSIISSIQTMHQLSIDNKCSPELLNYINRDEGNSYSSTGVSNTSKEYALYKASMNYVKEDLSNIEELKKLIDYNEIPVDAEQTQSLAQLNLSKKEELEKSIGNTINEISNDLYLNPTIHNIYYNKESKNLSESMDIDYENDRELLENELKSLKGKVKVTSDGYYDLGQTNLYSTHDFVDFEVFEKNNKQFIKEHKEFLEKTIAQIQENEKEQNEITLQQLIDNEAIAIAKGESKANPEVLHIANSARSQFFGDRFKKVDKKFTDFFEDIAPISRTMSTLQYYNDVFDSDEGVQHKKDSDNFLLGLAEKSENEKKLNILNRNQEKEDRVDFRSLKLPVEVQEKYSDLINEFKAKESRNELVESDYYEFTNYLNYLIQSDSEPYVIQRLRGLQGLPATPLNTKIQEFNSSLPVGEQSQSQETSPFKLLEELYPNSVERDQQISNLLYRGNTLEDLEKLQDLENLQNDYLSANLKKNIITDPELTKDLVDSIVSAEKSKGVNKGEISLEVSENLSKDDIQYNDIKNTKDVKNLF